MADPSVVTVRVVLGEPRTGLWCERCLLPSRVEVDLWWLRADGLHLFGAGSVCTNELELEPEPAPEGG